MTRSGDACARELADQLVHVCGHARSAGAPSAPPRLQEAKAATMPGQNRPWLHDMERRARAIAATVTPTAHDRQ